MLTVKLSLGALVSLRNLLRLIMICDLSFSFRFSSRCFRGWRKSKPHADRGPASCQKTSRNKSPENLRKLESSATSNETRCAADSEMNEASTFHSDQISVLSRRHWKYFRSQFYILWNCCTFVCQRAEDMWRSLSFRWFVKNTICNRKFDWLAHHARVLFGAIQRGSRKSSNRWWFEKNFKFSSCSNSWGKWKTAVAANASQDFWI